MKTKIIVSFAALLALGVETSFGQGLLTPPGAPAPTMKTLSQVEPRTPISSAPYVISAPGAYYLTTNLTLTTAASAITVSVSDVTLDLNGFNISATPAAASTSAGIVLGTSYTSGYVTNVTILNGTISSGVTNNGTTYGGSGFGFGIIYGDGCDNVRISGVSICGCLYYGIDLDGNNNVVEHCIANTTGDGGIVANFVSDSSAFNCVNDAIDCVNADNCYGTSIGSGDGINATSGNVNNSTGIAISGTGINALNAINCTGTSVTGYGVDASYAATSCTGVSSNNVGLYATTANNSYGYSVATSGTGINAATATGCYGYNYYGGTGLQANVAENCYGVANGWSGANTYYGCGLYANFSAMNCVGLNGAASGGYGLYANDVTTGCAGILYGSGTGLVAYIANGCYYYPTISSTHSINTY